MKATAEPTTIYFQWQKAHGYPVFLRMEKVIMEGRLQKLVSDLGFQEVSLAEQKRMPLDRSSTKVLTLTNASPRVAREICAPDTLARFGSETLSHRGGAQIYLYRHVGMMVFSPSSTHWELGIASELETTEDLMGLRVVLNRYLSWALAPHGLIGFWGVATNEGFVVMKQGQSFGEAVFVDVSRRLTFSSSGSKELLSGFVILRADRPGHTGHKLNREELISFLSTQTTYLSLGSMPGQLSRACLYLGTIAHGEWGGNSHASEGLSNA